MLFNYLFLIFKKPNFMRNLLILTAVASFMLFMVVQQRKGRITEPATNRSDRAENSKL